MSSSSQYEADSFVTAANPAPGRAIEFEYLVRSGTGWSSRTGTRYDGGIGQNIYVAGGAGPGGAVLVTGTLGVSLSGVSVSISGPLEVTSSQGSPVWVTGSVFVLNPSSGSGILTATITGVVAVSMTNPSAGGTNPASSGTHTTFSFSTSSVTLISANATRKAFSVYNDANQTYLIRLGPSASTGTWTFSLFPQNFYESPYPGYTGIVTGIGFTSGSGAIHVEELT